MEIVEDFDGKSYNNNGKPWISSRILRVNPMFFFSFLFLFSSFFSIFPFFSFFHFFICFIFFMFSSFFVFFSFCFSLFLDFHFFIFMIQSSEQTPEPEKHRRENLLVKMTIFFCGNSIFWD